MVKNLALVALVAALAAGSPIQHEARQLGLNVDRDGKVDLRPQKGVDVNVDQQKDGGKGANVGLNREGIQVGRPEKRDPQLPGLGLNVDKGGINLQPQSGGDMNVDQQKDRGKGANVGVNREGVQVGRSGEKRALDGIERPVLGG